MNARCVAVLVAAGLLAAACGGSDPETAEDSASSTTTTTTIAETVEPDAEEEAMAEDAEDASSTTTVAVDFGPVFPLTGEALGDADAPTTPALVLKISNNDDRSRAALTGLDHADIVFEERIEANATRFAAVFHSDVPDEVGPIRSARTSDVDIVSNLSNPVFGYSGSNAGVAGQLREADDQGLLTRVTAETGASPFYRNNSFSAPDNLMVGGPEMLDLALAESGPPNPVFDMSDTVLDLGVPSLGAWVQARSNASYLWNEDVQGYLRFQSEVPQVTQDGVQIAPANVVVLTTTYVASQIDATSVDAQTIGSGPVVVYSRGFRVEGTWTREFARDPYTLVTHDGQTIGLAPGMTWVSLTPDGTGRELTLQEAQSLG
jgi:hypothetical protein